AHLLISLVESLVETTEQLCKGQLNFRVSPIHGGVENPGPAVGTSHYVSTPEIAMQKGRIARYQQLGQARVKFTKPVQKIFVYLLVIVGKAQLGLQPALNKKCHPVGAGFVALR